MATRYEYNLTGTSWATYGSVYFGQTFTPSIGHTIRMVRVKLGSGGGVTHPFEILATSGGLPTGAAIASGTIPVRRSDAWAYIGLGAGGALSPSVMYAFKVFTGYPTTNISFKNDATGNPYAGGTFFTDSIWAGRDLIFEEWDASFPYPPLLVAPAHLATEISLTPTLEVTYEHCEATPHWGTQWQLDEDGGDFSSPMWDSGADYTHLLSIVVPEGLLEYNTTYVWRARHQDQYGEWGDWSEVYTYPYGHWKFTTSLAPFFPKIMVF